MSLDFQPGINVSDYAVEGHLIPILAKPPIKKSGNVSFTSYFLDSHSSMRPSVWRASHASSNDLYAGSSINQLYQLPDKGKKTAMFKLIDNGTVTCSSDDCKTMAAPSSVIIGVETPAADLMEEDDLNLYIEELFGACSSNVESKEVTKDGLTFVVHDWVKYLRGSTEIAAE